MSAPAELHRYTIDLLADNYTAIDADLPTLLSLLFERSAGEDWHKAGTFKHHLLSVYRCLVLWNQPREVRLLGLFHSVYGNEYVNLTLFDREQERALLREALGEEAESWVSLFCEIPRTRFVQAILEGEGRGSEGLTLVNDKQQKFHLTPRQVAAFIVVSVADVAEQWHSWQDDIFANYPHQRSQSLTDNWAASLWPGPLKPPANILAMLSSLLSALPALPQDTGIPIPPAFDHARVTIDSKHEAAASALYWQVITRMHPLTEMQTATHLLESAIKHNPWVGEPYLLLAQLAISQGQYQQAEAQALAGLNALQAWGTAWDKRIAWEGWVAWARILLQSARNKTWPKHIGGLNSLGLVE